MPGRKTDVQDAEWIADLLQHGLLTASIVPDQVRDRNAAGRLCPILPGFLQFLWGQCVRPHVTNGHDLPIYWALHPPEWTQMHGAE
ncbi:hypothetical protein [Ktedonobacter robiniae]|uniref:hypothetical protein n=1 Tax=Ktedonobacter robiniae TaxID=2778365 RepID=UPI001914DE99|nr:hypothetical protein [Ktedonobacter robiniae]